MIRNDFTCLGKRCRTEDGAATVYEDLPSGTTRCPVCGSKRVQKIFSANVGTGMARKVDGMLEHSGLREQLEARDCSRAVEQKDAHDRARPGDAVVAGFAGNMGSLIQKATAPWGPAQALGAGAGPNKPATLGQVVVLGQKLPRGGTGVEVPGVGRLKLDAGPAPTRDSLSDGKGRPKV